MSDLQTLLDQRDIVELTARYCWALDGHEWDVLSSVFAPDAAMVFSGQEHNGLAAIVARIRSTLEPLDASQHIVGSHVVAVDGDHARCRCYFHAQHIRHAADPPHLIVAGAYHDQLVRSDVGWRIAHRRLDASWRAGNPDVFVRP